MSASSMSKGFFEFVKSIGEAKSKQEEDGIIENELHILKSKMGARNVGPRQMREYLIRMVYVEMLGHDASFGHIHAVKLTRATKLVDKRVGYMACSLCLHKDHELMLLLVGGLQTDLQSQNQLEVSTALIVSCKLINEDTIPAILPLVDKLLNHSEASIRKKAIMGIQRFNELSVDSVTDCSDKAKRMLCDKDPSVMGASLHLLLDLVEADVSDFSDLVSSFVSILKQIIEHRLPKDYDYHRMPAPWTQIKLLQILALLGTANKGASEGMYEVLHEVMRRADIGINVGYAIIYECVRTVTTIYPNTQLLAEAAKCTSRFITSENHNLKYLGINALASIVQINPSAANEHQMIVIDCLEDKDETLRRKTLDLLYKMTNENNVNVICTKLIASLQDSVDVYLRGQLIEKITFLAEKFAPDTIWFIDTMARVFQMGADLVKAQFAHNFLKTLAEGIIENQEDEDSEEDIANYAADFFYQILIENLKKKRSKPIPNILLRIIAWVLGEYGQFCTGKAVDEEVDEEEEDELIALSPMEIIRTLWSVIEKQGENLSTRQWAMSATCKLCRHLDDIPDEINDIISKYKTSTHSNLVQFSHELVELCKERDVMEFVYTESTIVDDIKVDKDLKFLNKIVSQQIKDGKRKYAPPDDYDDSDDEGTKQASNLIFDHKSKLNDLQSTLVVKSVGNQMNMMPAEPQMSENHNVVEMDQKFEEPEVVSSGLGSSGRKRKGPWGDHIGKDSSSDDNNANGADVIQRAAQAYDKPVITVHDPFSGNNNMNSQRSNKSSVSQRSPPTPKTQKQIEAEKLFGLGGGNDLSQKRSKARKKKGFRKVAAKKKIVKKKKANPKKKEEEKANAVDANQGNDQRNDLLNFITDAPPKPQSDDLLGDIFGSNTPSQNAQPPTSATPSTTKSAPKKNDGVVDLMGDLFGASPSSSNVASNTNSASSPIGDIFGSLGSPATGSTLLGGTNKGFAALKTQLGAKVTAFPRSHETDQILFENSQLQISYFTIYKQQKSMLCVFISNVSGNALSNIQVSVKKDNAQCSLQFGFDVAASIPKPNLRNATTAIISSLNGNETSCQMISFGLTNPTQVSIPCNIQLSINNEILPIALKISDLMRPSQITTKDFGTNWGRMANGSFALNLNSGNANIPVYVERLTKALRCHHIATIKNEVIAAGNLSSIVNSNMLLPILIHCKCIQNKSYSLIIRTPNANISKAIGVELKQILTA